VLRAGICLREQVTEAVNPRATREAAIGLQFELILLWFITPTVSVGFLKVAISQLNLNFNFNSNA
jgi:hypothetical protein